MSRRTARKHVFSIIFQMEFQKDDMDNIIENYIEEIEENENPDDIFFIRKESKGIIKNQKQIDNIINDSVENWTVERIAKVDIAILRIAVYEFIYSEDIPQNVSINEAIELAKEFSSDKAPSFINGILGKAINIIPKDNI